MSGFIQRHTQEVDRILAKYPEDRKRSAVMPLLHLAQLENGYIDNHVLIEIAEYLEISTTDVASIVGFYTLYHDTPGGKVRFQICTDLPCALRGADRFRDELCAALGIRPGETTADGLITVEEVTCLAACDKAPMFQVQGKQGITYHENQTVDSALSLVNTFRKQLEEK